jgi:hypothetical protein
MDFELPYVGMLAAAVGINSVGIYGLNSLAISIPPVTAL